MNILRREALARVDVERRKARADLAALENAPNYACRTWREAEHLTMRRVRQLHAATEAAYALRSDEDARRVLFGALPS